MTLAMQTGEDNVVLRTVSKPIQKVTAEHRRFANKMVKTMHQQNGVGLAAPQVGKNIRLVICKLNPGTQNESIVPMVNPEIIEESKEKVDGEEGCLSLPGVWGNVERAKKIMLRYTNLKNEDRSLELSDFNARIIQHEIDHLNGVLFTDTAENIQEVLEGEEAPHI